MRRYPEWFPFLLGEVSSNPGVQSRSYRSCQQDSSPHPQFYPLCVVAHAVHYLAVACERSSQANAHRWHLEASLDPAAWWQPNLPLAIPGTGIPQTEHFKIPLAPLRHPLFHFRNQIILISQTPRSIAICGYCCIAILLYCYLNLWVFVPLFHWW